MIQLSLYSLTAAALGCLFLPVCGYFGYRFVRFLLSIRGLQELFGAHVEQLSASNVSLTSRVSQLELIVRNGLRDLAQETKDLRDGVSTTPQFVNPQAFGRSPIDALPSIDEAVKHVIAAQQNPELKLVPDLADPAERKRHLLVQLARKTVGTANACCNCQWWDHEGGQASIAQINPVFRVAAQHVLPNTMGRVVEYDEDGKEIPPDPSKQFPAQLNTWELFGACTRHNIGRHAVDKCDDFESLAKAV